MRTRTASLAWMSIVTLLLGPISLAAAQTIEPLPEPQPLPLANPGPLPDEPVAPAEEPATEEPTADEPEPVEAATASPEGDIIVTGSRIRTSFSATVPVDVVSRKQLQQSGINNMADVVQYLTVTQGTGIQGTNTAGPSGSTASGINLRGLGPGATLLLLNGRRLNPTGAAVGGAHFGDLSTIPLAAVERIEILKAGASAIYGADAVGGVVNVITRRNLNGVLLQGDVKTTTNDFDLQEYTGSTSFGATSEHARVMTALSYFRRTELDVGDRDWPADKLQSTFGGYPGYFYLLDDMRTQADPLCGHTAPRSESALVMSGPDATTCRTGYRNSIAIVPNAERVNAFSNAEFDLNDHLTLFGELLVSRYRGDSVQVPYAVVAGLPPGRPIVPADHVDNHYGQAAIGFIAPLGQQADSGRLSSADDSLRGVIGLKGDFASAAKDTLFESWDWELSASWGISRYREAIRDVLKPALQTALDSCSDPAHLENCYNPFSSATDGTGTPNSQAVLDKIFSRQVVQADHALQTYNAGMSGSLFPLPGGDVGLAFGAEIRREWRVTELDHDANLLSFGFLAGNSNATAERMVYSGYVELRWPLFNGIELQTAARGEHYSDLDATDLSISPFGGLTISPAEIAGVDNTPAALRALQFRANVSRSIRAPTIFNTYPGIGTFPYPFYYMGGVVYGAAQSHGNPDLTTENALTFSAGFTWSPVKQLNLTADYWYYDYQDRIQVENAQAVLDTHGDDPTRVMKDPVTGSLSSVQVYTFNVPGSIVTDGIDFGLTLRLDGSDVGGSKTDFGEFSLSAQGVFTLSYDVPRSILPGMPMDCDGSTPESACHVVGKRNGTALSDPPSLPRLRMNVPLSWSMGGHSVSLIGHYVGNVEDDVAPVVPDGTDDGGKIPSWISFDLQYGITLDDLIGKQMTVRVGCENIFDRRPPTPNGTQEAFLFEMHDPRGRMLYARLQAEF
jgi:iron complex outermembrane receptor protein